MHHRGADGGNRGAGLVVVAGRPARGFRPTGEGSWSWVGIVGSGVGCVLTDPCVD